MPNLFVDSLPVTSADGGNVAQGAVADAAVGDASGTLNAHLRQIARIMSAPSFSLSDSVTRPANATAYAASQAINCNCAVTALVSIVSKTVTLTVANALAVGDRFTVVGVDGNFTNAANIDGNWIAIAGTNATTLVFTVSGTPTGTPATSSHGTIAKMMSLDVAGVNGGMVVITDFKVSLPGKGMTGAIRVYFDTSQVTVLVDAASYSLLIANTANRKTYIDLNPVTEDTNSDCTIGVWQGKPITIKCAANDTRIYLRLVAEAAGTPANAGVVSVLASGFQTLV
jgi:hypothetical protein